LVTGAGIEPATLALKVRCSTTELPGQIIADCRLQLLISEWLIADVWSESAICN
jgi:hypothetical protein